MALSSERPMDAWACLRQAHASCVCFAREFRKFGALARTNLFWRRRFEPKISLAATFLRKRSLSNAIFSRFPAAFIHSDIGSSQCFCFCSISEICSSSDFFSESNFDFSLRYTSRSISCSKYPSRSRWSFVCIATMRVFASFAKAETDWAESARSFSSRAFCRVPLS